MKPSSRAADSTSPAGIDRTAIGGPAPSHLATPNEQFPQHQDWDGAPIEPAADDLDLLAEPERKVTRLTVILAAAVIAGLAFVGGVMVQKQFGTSAGAAGGMSAASGQMPSGSGESGEFPGGAGGFGEGMGDAGAAASAGTGGDSAAAADTATPVLVGTVTKVSGNTLTVKNFGGVTVTVKVPAGTTISDSSDTALSGLAKGATVSVTGTEADDGTVTASTITAS